MKNFCVIEKNSRENHAGSKARNDVAEILENCGYTPVCVHHSEEKGTLDKLKMSVLTLSDWNHVSKVADSNNRIIIQYPLAMYPKVSQLAVPFVRKMKKKNTRIILLIHDLESLRGLTFASEKEFLELADEVIVHNEKMKQYLLEKGYSFQRIHILGLFDYRIPGFQPASERNRYEIAIAGNLKAEKCGFLKDLKQVQGNLEYHLYGPNYQETEKNPQVIYEGQYTPEQLPSVMKEGWGLVWDGGSVHECQGAFGGYLKFNNPHKASLYLASGMPVIVWEQAAIAPWIREQKLGLTVKSLEEIPELINRMTEEEYKEMHKAISRDCITLVKYKDRDVLPITPERYKRIMIVHVKGAESGMGMLMKAMGMGGGKNPAEMLKERLCEKGFDAFIYESPLDAMKKQIAAGEKPNINLYFAGKNAIDDFVSGMDLVITLCDVSSGRPSFGLSKGGGEIPWYVFELPVVVIGCGQPTMLADVPQARTYINTYDAKPATFDALVDDLMAGPDAFKGRDPIDSFCGLFDARL